MINTTLCYVLRGDEVLMLHRIAKPDDENEGKWIGVGGKLEENEDPASAALRELREETGATPDEFLPLGAILPSPGCYGETLHLYLARDLRMEDQTLDEDEFLNVERIPFDEMVRRCMNGEIQDAKTIIAVLKAKELLGL